jgi:hypothetical protein
MCGLLLTVFDLINLLDPAYKGKKIFKNKMEVKKIINKDGCTIIQDI